MTAIDELAYEFICYGGDNEAKRFGHDLRRRIILDVLPALRDAETDLEQFVFEESRHLEQTSRPEHAYTRSAVQMRSIFRWYTVDAF
jgi:hypothetical protein